MGSPVVCIFRHNVLRRPDVLIQDPEQTLQTVSCLTPEMMHSDTTGPDRASVTFQVIVKLLAVYIIDSPGASPPLSFCLRLGILLSHYGGVGGTFDQFQNNHGNVAEEGMEQDEGGRPLALFSPFVFLVSRQTHVTPYFFAPQIHALLSHLFFPQRALNNLRFLDPMENKLQLGYNPLVAAFAWFASRYSSDIQGPSGTCAIYCYTRASFWRIAEKVDPVTVYLQHRAGPRNWFD
ncbi:hypothetical protein C8R44DRAFT_728546 [Mycena epipterygia]|nr:hypothetical protein C8R44DRAFT_728546 [Mycena epipterygia]